MKEYLLFKGLVLKCLCYFESIFVCLFLIETDVVLCRYCLLTFIQKTALKNLNSTKTLEVAYQILIKSSGETRKIFHKKIFLLSFCHMLSLKKAFHNVSINQ